MQKINAATQKKFLPELAFFADIDKLKQEITEQTVLRKLSSYTDIKKWTVRLLTAAALLYIGTLPS